MANRTAYIISSTLQALQDEGQRKITSDDLLAFLNEIQREICEEALALEFKRQITLTSGKETYGLDRSIVSVASVETPSTWTLPFKIIQDANVWADIVRSTDEIATGAAAYGIVIPSMNPQYGIIWDDKLELFPVPVTSGEKLSLRVYAYPVALKSQQADPEISDQYDKCLRLGLLHTVAKGPWTAEYRGELEKRKHMRMKNSIAGALTTEHSSDRLRF